MLRFLLRRLAWMIPSFLGITLIVYSVLKASPGDPLSLAGDLGLSASATSAKAMEEYRRLTGLDDPALVGWVKWLWALLHGDFGTSFKDGRPVLTRILEALPVTLGLSLASLLITYALAIPIGVFAAIRRGTAPERAITLATFVLYSLPAPWVAMLLVAWASRTRLLPIQGLHGDGDAGVGDLFLHLVLPLACLSYASFAVVSRYVRTSIVDVMRQDYIRTARAKGLSERAIVLRHALRNALLPVITLLGLTLPTLIGGSVIVERIFGLPGMGKLSFDSILSKDIPVLMGTTSFAAVLTLVGLMLSDVLYAFADPRIRLDRR